MNCVRCVKPCLISLSLLLLIAGSLHAMGPAGDTRTLDQTLNSGLEMALKAEGYWGRFQGEDNLQRSISAFLWNNRDRLTTVEISKSREVDMAFCLLIIKGHVELEPFDEIKSTENWCKDYLIK